MFSSKALNLIKIILSITIIVIILDIFINFLIPENIKKKIGTTRNYSLKSEKFHHEIAPNINLYEYWGIMKYKVKTNQYSMRISDEDSTILDKNKINIGFMGDSFVYGSGINYEKHFLNILKKENNKYNLLNLGYVSYSPSIYFKRIKFYIEDHNIKFNKIFLFVDTSDIQDEGMFYREDKNGNIVRAWLNDKDNFKRNKKFIIKNYLQQNSFIFKIYQILSAPTIPEKSLACLKNKKKTKNFAQYLNNERFGYGFDQNIQKQDWVKIGHDKTITYLNKIKELSIHKNFELIILYYPSAIEILKEQNLNESLHYKLLSEWSFNNNIRFINTSNDFQKTKIGIKNYKNNFILCDVHWNDNGHNLIAKNINKYFSNN